MQFLLLRIISGDLADALCCCCNRQCLGVAMSALLLIELLHRLSNSHDFNVSVEVRLLFGMLI